MPHDIAQEVYRYLARDWGLATDNLTTKKLQLLKENIPTLRSAYHANRPIAYDKPIMRRAYLAAFSPRYAYILYECLEKIKADAIAVLKPWHRGNATVGLIGGGPACEVFGLLDWLYTNRIEPRYLRLVIVDRERYWRSFHSFLFSELTSKYFRKTMVIPSYESVDIPVSSAAHFDRDSVAYNYSQSSLLAEARLLSIVNCLSELNDYRGVKCHMHYLTHLAWNNQLVVCADSNAKKRRPRMKWMKDAFDGDTNLCSSELFSGSVCMTSNWLGKDLTTAQIFPNAGAPRWENQLKRWVYIRRIG